MDLERSQQEKRSQSLLPRAPLTRSGDSLRALLVLIGLLALWNGPSAWAALEPSQVLILVNKDTKISSEVAQMYQKQRGIPATNVLKLSLGTGRAITLEQYRTKVAAPVKKYLEDHAEIRCIVTTSGVPYTLQVPANDGAAFDNELAISLRDEVKDRRSQTNPLFLRATNIYGIADPRKFKMVYVSRLDGPDLKIIKRMVEDAVAAEKTGLQGPVFGDARGIDGIAAYGEGDFSIRAAIDLLSGAGFESKLDLKEATWLQPGGGVGNQAAGAAFYVGWYQYRDFQNIFGQQGLARGAIAWHIASGEAINLWDANEKGWCVNLLRRGAAVTLGPVREPFVHAFPRGDVFVERLLAGATVAESYWFALPNASWNMVLLGDPLYRPFALKPRPALAARAYILADANHILGAGKTGALMIQVESIGPEGSTTPALSAIAEPGMGLAAASGSVFIPPLRAGQTAVIRVPSVTAGNDPTGMFRLNLNVQTEGKESRRIVLEGRTGFSRLTGGLLSMGQMFVSPNGEFLISGQPGNNVLIEPDNLRTRSFSLGRDLQIVTAAFSPDSAHVLLALAEAQQKKLEFVIAKSNLEKMQPLPPEMGFLRWLGNDEILANVRGGLIAHNIAGGMDRAFESQEGWVGMVIHGTDTQFLLQPGKVAVKKGSEPLQEILQGVNGLRSVAVTDDLSMFGGLDAEKRFWVQHGLQTSPVVADSPVEALLWGPIGRRVLVRKANGRSRVYDGRDGTWTDLGRVSGAQWSYDEERLLFLRSEADAGSETPTFLSLMIGKRLSDLCRVARIGHLLNAVFSSDGNTAFLLAGLAGGDDVWMMDLTPITASEAKAPLKRPEGHFVISK